MENEQRRQLITLEVMTAWPTEKWTQFEIETDDFLRYLDEKCPGDPSGLYIGDLLLVFACLQAPGKGKRAAQELFAKVYLARIPTYLLRCGFPEPICEDTAQSLAEKLLHPLDGKPPKLQSFNGTGPLLAWLKTVASREAGLLRRGWQRAHGTKPAGQNADAPLEESIHREPKQPLAGQRGGLSEPENALARQDFAELLKPALECAVEKLPAEKRDIQLKALHRYFVEEQDIKAIGVALKVHYSTVFRWIEVFLDTAYGEVCRMARESGIAASEPDDLATLVSSQLDLSLPRILRLPAERNPPQSIQL